MVDEELSDWSWAEKIATGSTLAAGGVLQKMCSAFEGTTNRKLQGVPFEKHPKVTLRAQQT